jgi:DNA gyrase/topoisomerase IV subunit A
MRPKIIDEIKESKYQDTMANLEQKIEQLTHEQQSDKQRIKILEEGLTQCKMHIACISVAIVGGILFTLYQVGIIR